MGKVLLDVTDRLLLTLGGHSDAPMAPAHHALAGRSRGVVDPPSCDEPDLPASARRDASASERELDSTNHPIIASHRPVNEPPLTKNPTAPMAIIP
jgi:hypothetical protein